MSRRSTSLLVAGLLAAGLAAAVAVHLAATRGPRTPGAQPQRPQRIVALAPNAIETVFALGAGGRVVGVGDFGSYPPEAVALPRVGGTHNPNVERLVSLKPDLVIVQGKAAKYADFGRRYGVRILHLQMDSIETIGAGIDTLGEALGLEAQAVALNRRIGAALDAVRRRVSGRRRPRVFVSLGRQIGSLRELYSIGGASFLSELLDAAGGANVFADVRQPYPKVNKESLLERKPDVVLELRAGEELSAAARRKLLADWQALGSLPAVRDGRIHVLTDDFLLIPGPRVARTAARLAGVLHPDAEGAQ